MFKYKCKQQTSDVRDYKFHLQYKQLIDPYLPSKINLLDEIILPVLTQGDLGSCTANATSNAILFYLKKSNKKEFQPSRLYIYYFSRLIENDVENDSGCSIRSVLRAIVEYGACDEKIYPYNIENFKIKPKKNYIKNGKKKVKKIKYLAVDRDLNIIKNCLSQGHPIILGINLYKSSEVLLLSNN